MDALFYADLLIRSVCFGLVILNTYQIALKQLRRLQRLAKIHDVVLVWLHASHQKRLEGVVSHRVRLSVKPPDLRLIIGVVLRCLSR